MKNDHPPAYYFENLEMGINPIADQLCLALSNCSVNSQEFKEDSSNIDCIVCI